MKSFREYWTFSAIRGVLTIVVAAGMVGLPLLATGIFPMPMLLGLTVDVMAAYFLMDCGAMVLLALELPKAAKHRKVLYAQAAASMAVGGLLYAMVGARIDMRWLGVLVALQASVAAASEWIVGMDTHKEYHCLSCYASAIALTVCAASLPALRLLNNEQTALVLAGYVGLFGATQAAVGARMLFKEYRASHPATQLSMSWQQLMDRMPAEKAVSRKVCPNGGVCSACAAEAQCFDFSMEGQLAQVQASRAPAIVRTVRAASVTQGAVGR
jgi:hypothetical protein